MNKKTIGQTFEVLKEQYLVTTLENLDQIETKILRLENDKSNIEELLSQILGEVHSVKGSSGSFEFSFLSTVCHNFEDLIVYYMDQPKEDLKKELDMDKLLKFLDYTKDVIRHYLDNSISLDYIKQKFNNLSINSSGRVRLNKILLVESVQFLARSIILSLEDEGYEISIARDGYEAFGRLLNEDFDILISSQSLKTLNGSDLIKCVKAINKSNFDIHTILLTSNKNVIMQEMGKPDKIFYKNSKMVSELLAYINGLEETVNSINVQTKAGKDSCSFSYRNHQ